MTIYHTAQNGRDLGKRLPDCNYRYWEVTLTARVGVGHDQKPWTLVCGCPSLKFDATFLRERKYFSPFSFSTQQIQGELRLVCIIIRLAFLCSRC